MLPNESSHKANNKADGNPYEKGYHSFSSSFLYNDPNLFIGHFSKSVRKPFFWVMKEEEKYRRKSPQRRGSPRGLGERAIYVTALPRKLVLKRAESTIKCSRDMHHELKRVPCS